MLKGQLLNDRYRIIRLIGGGGMANVYLAEDVILNRKVAVKALRMEYINDEEFIARFDREAQAATSLSHPNIVNIYDIGEEDQISYMVMEYVDGLTLKEYIQTYGPIEVHEALNIMKQITSAIHHAHLNGIVHRDIKPQNILIDSFGTVKVTDFGIAVALSATSLTKTNSILGSVHYLSPEQARGGTATKKSDIYSLGIVFYELLTGKLPFSGQTPVSIALKHLQSDIPSVRDFISTIPQSVENIVLKATAKDPFHRYENVYEMQEAIETAFLPHRMNEEKFIPPVEPGDETKAIPIITDQLFEHDLNQDTIIHRPNETTKRFENIQTENEKQDQMKSKKRKRRGIIFSLIAFILIASIFVSLFVLPKLLKPNEVEIPHDIIGMHYEDVIEQLESIHLKATIEYMFSDEFDKDHVIQTDPKPGRKVVEGSEVTVYVSDGKETVVFSDYVGRDFSQVERLLKDRGFEKITVYEKYSDKTEGEIIAQIQPEPDEEVIPSETEVIFEVSIGPELISLINLENMTEQEAEKYLTEHGLQMNKIEQNSDSIESGKVISQFPEAHTNVQKGDRIDVYISIGPEEKAPISHYVTFTVPYTLDRDGEENEEPVPQEVQIYVEDMNHDITDVYQGDLITENREYTITLLIEEGKSASYKVIRDGEVIIDRTIPYEEGD